MSGEVKSFPLIMLLALFYILAAATLTSTSTSPTSETRHRYRLLQLDPVERNHAQDLKLQSGQVLQIKTLAKEPPLFEIPGFLSAAECDHIKQLALKMGLFRSTVKQDMKDDTEEEGFSQDLFHEIDTNQDEVLDVHEVLEALDMEVNTFLRPEDALQIFQDVRLDPNGDGFLSLDEFVNIDNLKMAKIKEWIEEHSEDGSRLNRVSQQTWLSQDGEDDILTDLRKRTTELTGLPHAIVEHSELLQVVYYEPGGHYHAHYDSEEVQPDQRCSHTVGLVHEEGEYSKDSSSRLCRFITILYYLDDTTEGGETAFPVADNLTFSEEDLSMDSYDLSRHCYDANLYVKPEKGKAVMWYNHYINDTTGWLGPMNLYSLHGGCDVTKGTKWIANNWITADDSYDKQMLYMEAKESLKLRRSDFSPEEADFIDALHSLREIWTSYLQSPAGSDAAKQYFVGEPVLQDMVDNLVDYVVRNSAEIQVEHCGGADVCEYKIIWGHKADETNFNEKVVTVNEDLSDFILVASRHGRNTEIDISLPKQTRVFKNPHRRADGGKVLELNQLSDNVHDTSLEKRNLDEL